MRALQPDVADFVERDGVKLYYELFGADHRRTVMLLPTWSIIHSRFWKAQVPYLARRYRVVVFDGRGCGRSDRPVGAPAYDMTEYAADAVAVLDATASASAVLVGLSSGVLYGLHVAGEHPERVDGLVAIGAATPFEDILPNELERMVWEADVDDPQSWQKYNRGYWLDGGYDDFLRFFFSEMFPEPHSTKQIEDCIGWGHEIDAETLAWTTAARLGCEGAALTSLEPLCANLRCPVLVLHGSDDTVCPHPMGARLAELTNASMVTIDGSGHGLPARDPVRINHLIRDFVDGLGPRQPYRTTWTRARRRPPRVLYLSSPIGLGHARRDVAIAASLREQRPGVQIDWLSQDPVTRVLEGAGERVHAASRWLASESSHVEDECADHDLHAFQAIRSMDEILVNNFMVFDDVVNEGAYDLVVADEAWEVDYFLHENPELKRFSFAWLTDFVGWIPMPDGGAAEAALTADYNAEMIEQRARFHRLRDRSIFVGDPDDIVPGTFGDGLPSIRAWTEAEFDFAGYVTGFDPVGDDERAALRGELGYRPDRPLCIVTVGGTGVGATLLHRFVDALPRLRRDIDDLEVLLVSGPRLDARSFPEADGLRVVSYLPNLHRHLAVCDVAVVQGGLTTCMELTANRRPFVYVPLQHHFEQQFHVRHRLDRYGAGTCLPFDAFDPESLSQAVVDAVQRPLGYLPVDAGGAARAGSMLADLL